MSHGDLNGTDDWDAHVSLVSRIEQASEAALLDLPGVEQEGFVSSELVLVHKALQSVLEQDLHRGMLFCEWGSGLGAVCALAASLGLEAHGIEIQAQLVDASQVLLADLDLEANIVHGSFVQPGDEDLVAGCEHTCTDATPATYGELGLPLAMCDIVFAYPWPGEEEMHDRIFWRHATPGALLLTFAEHAGVLVQRRPDGGDELESLGWLGRV